MISTDSANFQSLNMIRDELVVTIEQAARDLEVFISDGNEKASFDACLSSIQQTLGVLRVLELKGASILAEELHMTAKTISPDDPLELMERKLELVSTTFFVLTRYLEHVQATEQAIPVLLVPYINQLRKFRKEPLLSESFFFHANLGVMPSLPSVKVLEVSEQEFQPLLIRLRHMYQFGLLGVLKQKNVPASFNMMRRSLLRMQRLGDGQPLCVLWWMASIALDAMAESGMEMIEPRKMLLSRLDRIIRQVQKGGVAAYSSEPPKGLIKELLYLILLSGYQSKDIDGIKKAFNVEPLSYDDKALAAERRRLQGPSAHTMSSLVRVLRIEINNIKKVLESASQGSGLIDDIEALVDALIKIAETLGVVGLVGPSSILKQDIELVKQWSSTKEVDDEELNRSAKVLLYMESAVDSLENARLSEETLRNTSEESQNEIINSSELAIAQKIVLTECEAGVALAKRAITSYSESDCDAGHIINVAKTLDTVRGGLLVLGRSRAALVVEACVHFIDQVLLQKTHPPELNELLETFADAIISIEYFMSTSGEVARLDDSVLQVAEESLSALGYPISNG